MEELHFDNEYSEALQQEIREYGLPWLRVGCCITNAAGQYLTIQEAKAKISGVWQPVEDGPWNFPAGRVNCGETLINAALREAREESGYIVLLKEICAITYRTTLDNPYQMVVFRGIAIEQVGKPNPAEVSQVRWCSREELAALDRQKKLRSPKFIMKAINSRHSIDLNLVD